MFARFFKLYWCSWSGMASGGFMIPAAIMSAMQKDTGWKEVWWALAFLAFLWTAYSLWKDERKRADDLNERLIPKLRAYGNKNELGCIVEATHQIPISNYFRIVVVNDGNVPATGCTAFLSRISRNGVVLMAHEKRQLTYVPGHQADTLEKTLYSCAPVFLDVLMVTKSGDVAIITKTPDLALDINGAPVFTAPGTYDLSVSLVSLSTPTVNIRLKFDWTGNWKTCELRYDGLE